MNKLQRTMIVIVMAVVLVSYGSAHSARALVARPADTATSFHFVMTADSRDNYTVLPDLSHKMVTLNPAFGFFAGDLCGSFDVNCINNQWKPALDGNNQDGILGKTFVSRGNHDNGTLSTWQGLWDFQTMATRVGATQFTAQSSDATYSFDYGNSHFAVVDLPSGGSNSWTSAEVSWLDADLTAAEGRGLVHEFLFSHGPMYGVTSQHGSEQPSAALKAVLNKHPISAGFHGHEHVTAYTHVTPSREAGINDYEQFTMGRSGAPAYSVGKAVDWSASQNAFADIAVNGNDFTVTVYGQSGSSLFSKTFTDGSPAPTSTPGATATGIGTTKTPTPGATATGVAATKTPTPTSTAGQTLNFGANADTYVDASAPTANYGTLTTLRVDGSPDVHSYLRFSVQGLGGQAISRAQLQVYANSASSSGIKALAVSDNSWVENTVNYNNDPALGSVLATSAAVTTGSWVTLDVTSYVRAEGTYSFGLNTPGSTAISLQSRQASSNPPRLVITAAGAAATNTPTPAGATATNTVIPTQTTIVAPTDTPSWTPTNVSVPTDTPAPTNTPIVAPTDTPIWTPTNVSVPTDTPVPTNTPIWTPTNVSVPTNTPAPTATQGTGRSVTFVPGADSYVNSASPTTNYGTMTTLRVDGSPDVHSYLRFSVQGLGGQTVTRARLQVFREQRFDLEFQALAVADNAWVENTINYNNDPPLGTVLASAGPVTTGAWVTLDVTAYVTRDGTYNFGLNTPGATAISLASREIGCECTEADH